MPPRTSDKQLSRARGLRRAQTKAEEILWRSLRDRGIGAKFRRQVPIGPYIVDFACVAAKLVVEVDGPSHDDPEQLAYDRRRDIWLRDQGWRVLRVSNELAVSGGDLALEPVKTLLRAAAPSSDPR